MVSPYNEHPVIIIILIGLLSILALGGIGGGLSMLADPSGDLLGIPLVLLENVNLRNYLLPGMFLLVVMGVLPLVTAVGLWRGQQTAWIATAGISIVLILWICFQIVLWGAPILIQVIYLLLGVVILGLSFHPSVKSYFRGRDT